MSNNFNRDKNPWDALELRYFKEAYAAGSDVATLASMHCRTPGEVIDKLVECGLKEDPCQLRPTANEVLMTGTITVDTNNLTTGDCLSIKQDADVTLRNWNSGIFLEPKESLAGYTPVAGYERFNGRSPNEEMIERDGFPAVLFSIGEFKPQPPSPEVVQFNALTRAPAAMSPLLGCVTQRYMP